MLPAIRGVIDRRVLVNYRVEASALDAVLPEPFVPKTVDGYGVGGICLIRLRDVRPRGLPATVGVGSENAAHRIAVEWEADGERREGVYVPRRDTDSRMIELFGGRLFPGHHHRATFRVAESGDRFDVEMESDDGETAVGVVGEVGDTLPDGSIFEDVDEASAFFERGSLGYSPIPGTDEYEGLELDTFEWAVTPLDVERAHSSFFEDGRVDDADVSFDCALLMQDVPHAWHEREPVCAPAVPAE